MYFIGADEGILTVESVQAPSPIRCPTNSGAAKNLRSNRAIHVATMLFMCGVLKSSKVIATLGHDGGDDAQQATCLLAVKAHWSWEASGSLAATSSVGAWRVSE